MNGKMMHKMLRPTVDIVAWAQSYAPPPPRPPPVQQSSNLSSKTMPTASAPSLYAAQNPLPRNLQVSTQL